MYAVKYGCVEVVKSLLETRTVYLEVYTKVINHSLIFSNPFIVALQPLEKCECIASGSPLPAAELPERTPLKTFSNNS